MFDPPNSKKMELICLDADAVEALVEKLVEKIKVLNDVKESPYLATEEACQLMKCNDDTLRKYWKGGQITRSKLSNGHIVYDRESILNFIKKNTEKFDDGRK